MEDLFEKFYGKPESEGSSPPPVSGDPAGRPEQGPQFEQRLCLVETQLLEIAKAQQTMLSRLDTMAGQHPEQPKQEQEPPPPRSSRSDDESTRACTICGRQFPAKTGKMVCATHGPATLHCPTCYEKYRSRQQAQIIVIVVVIVVVVIGGLFLMGHVNTK